MLIFVQMKATSVCYPRSKLWTTGTSKLNRVVGVLLKGVDDCVQVLLLQP
jgi:hypothetical protein